MIVIGIKGYFRLRTFNKDTGKKRIDTGWFPNLILDTGRNALGTQSDVLTSCQVGTSDTAPNVGQAALVAYHAGTSDIRSTLTGSQSAASPYYGWKRLVYRFAAGTVAANLTEVGVGWATTGSTLFSRALILDPDLQTPTTITPLADEFLEVSYELRYYAPVADATSPSVTLDGTVYDTVTRAAEVNSSHWHDNIGKEIKHTDGGNWVAYDGALGTQLQSPSGNGAGLSSSIVGADAYSNNSYERIVHNQCAWNDWNLGAGIRSIRIRTTAGSFQTSFTANPGGTTIPKTSGYTMVMKWKIAWAAL